MDGVYTRVRSGEVVPEMLSAVSRARKVLEVAAFAEDLDQDVGNTGDDTLGPQRGAAARIWFHPLCMLRDALAQAVVAPDFRTALRGYRRKDTASLARVRRRGGAASSSSGKKPRLP